MSALLSVEWDGDVMRPLRRFVAQANRDLVCGQRYLVEFVDEAQSALDRGYHARIREAWTQLPEGLSEQFPGPADFRRHLLVACGFATTKRLRFASAQAAMDALPVFAGLAAVVEIEGAVVIVKTPMSQRLRGGMKKDERLRSYRETEELAATLIGIRREDLEREAERAA